MNPSDIPIGAQPENIGQIVMVQVFKKDKDDNLVVDSLIKYIGVLESFHHSKTRFVFFIRGAGSVKVEYVSEYCEIFTLAELAKKLDSISDAEARIFEIVNAIQQRASTMGPQNIRMEVRSILSMLKSIN